MMKPLLALIGLLGFEVQDLQEFVKKYQDSGGKLDGQIATASAANLSVVQLTDPWGNFDRGEPGSQGREVGN